MRSPQGAWCCRSGYQCPCDGPTSSSCASRHNPGQLWTARSGGGPERNRSGSRRSISLPRASTWRPLTTSDRRPIRERSSRPRPTCRTAPRRLRLPPVAPTRRGAMASGCVAWCCSAPAPGGHPGRERRGSCGVSRSGNRSHRDADGHGGGCLSGVPRHRHPDRALGLWRLSGPALTRSGLGSAGNRPGRGHCAVTDTALCKRPGRHRAAVRRHRARAAPDPGGGRLVGGKGLHLAVCQGLGRRSDAAGLRYTGRAKPCAKPRREDGWRSP